MAVSRMLARASVPAALAVVAAGLVATAPTARAEDPSCLGQAATIVGSGTITGTAGNDVIVGSAGVDTIDAGGGDDVVCDGAGADVVNLGDGDDTVGTHTARDPHDVFDGGAGHDEIRYQRTRALKLTLWNTTTDDGEAFEADKLLDFEGAVGGSGNDTITGSFQEDVLDGGAGNDTIAGLQAADTLRGSGGDDIFNESTVDPPGNDDIFGGAGTDEVSYSVRVEPVRINLDGVNYSGQAGEDDLIREVENARGGSGNDTIYGTDGRNKLYGGAGVDIVYDGLGADAIEGGAVCDYIVQPADIDPGVVFSGGVGTCDYVTYRNRTVDLTVRLNTTAAVNGAVGEKDVLKGIEQADGGSGDDVITGNGGYNVLWGGAGSDVLNGLGGSDTVMASDGVGGNDTVSCSYGYYDYAAIDPGDTATGCETVQEH